MKLDSRQTVSMVIFGSIKSDNYLNLSDRYIGSVILNFIIFILDLLLADMKITYYLQNKYNSNTLLNAMSLIIFYCLSRCF